MRSACGDCVGLHGDGYAAETEGALPERGGNGDLEASGGTASDLLVSADAQFVDESAAVVVRGASARSARANNLYICTSSWGPLRSPLRLGGIA